MIARPPAPLLTFEAADPGLLHRSSPCAGIRGLVFSFLLHGSVAAFALVPSVADFGAVERPSQAISVELLTTSVLEAVTLQEASEAAASPVATAREAGAPEAAAPASTKPTPVPLIADEPEAVRQAYAPPASPLTAEGPMVEESEVTAKEVAAREPPPEPQHVEDEDEAEVKLERPRETRRPERREWEQRTKPRRAGGVTARGSAGQTAAGRTSASSGAILSYAAKVRARVARNKPAGTGRHATVVVSFGVTTSGGLGYARIARSSGDSSLDRASLSAVRGAAPFPQPPPGASASQLRFSIPFYFN